jgi:hypothetical protein
MGQFTCQSILPFIYSIIYRSTQLFICRSTYSFICLSSLNCFSCRSRGLKRRTVTCKPVLQQHVLNRVEAIIVSQTRVSHRAGREDDCPLRYLLTFRRNLLPPSSRQNMDIAGSSETLVPTHQKTRRQNPHDNNLNDSITLKFCNI